MAHNHLEYRLRLMQQHPRVCCNWIFSCDFAPLERAFAENHEQYRKEFLAIEEQEKPKVSGIEKLIGAVMEGLAPSSQSMLSKIVYDYVMNRKETEDDEDRAGEVSPLMEISIRKLLRSRIRKESTGVVWYHLLYNNRQSIRHVAEREIDNGFVKKETSYENLIQLIDRLYIRERDGPKFCKNDAYLMYEVIDQNIDPTLYKNHQNVAVINNRKTCQIRFGRDVYVMEAEHKSGKDFCRQTGKRFVEMLLNSSVPCVQVMLEVNPEIPVEDETEKFLYCLDIIPFTYPLPLAPADAEDVTVYAYCTPAYLRNPPVYMQALRVIRDRERDVLECPAVRKFYVE